MNRDPLALWRIISLLAAMILMILPLPKIASYFWPQWVLFVLFVWLMIDDRSFNLLSVWCCGIVVDLLLGSPLGLHALVYTAMTYVLLRLYRQIMHFPTWQQSIVLALFVMMNFVTVDAFYRINGIDYNDYQWISIVTTAFIWPWVKHLFNIHWQAHHHD